MKGQKKSWSLNAKLWEPFIWVDRRNPTEPFFGAQRKEMEILAQDFLKKRIVKWCEPPGGRFAGPAFENFEKPGKISYFVPGQMFDTFEP